jgi:hypothetical protein
MFLPILLMSFKSYAQDSTKTLIHFSEIKQLGLYFAPEYQYGQLKSQYTSFAGGSAMLLVNKKFAFGFTMQQSVYLSYSPTDISPLVLKGSFGGLKLEYTCHPDAAVHLSFPLVIGGGYARADSANYVDDNNDMSPNQYKSYRRRGIRNSYFIVQPGVNVEANLVRFVKIFAGVNYRFSIPTYSTSTTNIIPASTLQGLGFSIGLKMGLFDFNVHRKK